MRKKSWITSKAKTLSRKAVACLCAAVMVGAMVPASGLALATADDGVVDGGTGAAIAENVSSDEALTTTSVDADDAEAASDATAATDEVATVETETNASTLASTTSTTKTAFAGNSWRYSNGLLIGSDEVATGRAWTWNGSGYINEAGGVISNAVTKGIDVSEWQGKIDWAQVKADGVDFAIIRCGYGDNETSMDDDWWNYNVTECERLGIPYGVYLYSYADETYDATSEAAHCIRLLQGHHPTLPVYYDLEENDMKGRNSFLKELATKFCNEISAAGYTPGIYSSLSWWNSYLTDSCFNNWERWVAQWNNSCSYSGTYHVWQAASDGQVNGVSGNVDIDFEMGWSYTTSGVVDEYVDPETPYDEVIADGAYTIASKLSSTAVLDVASGSCDAGANIQIYEANATEAQSFEVERDATTGYVRLKNTKSGKYLGLQALGSGYGTNVVQKTYDASDNSLKWLLVKQGTSIEVVAAINTEYALDLDGASTANGTNVQVYKRNNTDAQRFSFVSLYETPGDVSLDDGFYTIKSKIDGSFAVDVPGSSTAAGAKMGIYQANGTYAQVFRFAKTKDGYYRITSLSSGMALGLEASAVSGTRVIQEAPDDNARDQYWSLRVNDDGTYTLYQRGTSLALDIAGGIAVNNTAVQVWVGNDTKAQEFTLEAYKFSTPLTAGNYVVRSSAAPTLSLDSKADASGDAVNVELCDASSIANRTLTLSIDEATGLYTIAVSGNYVLDANGASYADGTNVQQYTSNNTLAQKWILERGSDGLITLRSALRSTSVVDIAAGRFVTGANAQLYTSNGTAAQRFACTKDYSLGVEARTVKSALNADKVLDVSAGSMASGANIQLYESNGTAAQQFALAYDSATGFYTLINKGSGLVLDVSGASTANCANVQQYASNGTLAQRWALLPCADGTYVIASALNATKVLDVAGGSTANGANVQIYDTNGTNAQHFSL